MHAIAPFSVDPRASSLLHRMSRLGMANHGTANAIIIVVLISGSWSADRLAKGARPGRRSSLEVAAVPRHQPARRVCTPDPPPRCVFVEWWLAGRDWRRVIEPDFCSHVPLWPPPRRLAANRESRGGRARTDSLVAVVRACVRRGHGRKQGTFLFIFCFSSCALHVQHNITCTK
jgi:hypothetical protein